MTNSYNTPIRMLPPYSVTARMRIASEVQDYNIRMMNIPAMWRKTRGAGVRVAMLDTGVPRHSDIRIAGGWSALGEYIFDDNGHQTFCAGILAATANNGVGVIGVAPECELHCGTVLDANGSGTVDNIIRGIRWAVDEAHAHIISMSLGIAAGAPHFADLESACVYAKSRGVAIFAASGNESGRVGQPAIYASVIACAAVNSGMEHAAFSNSGSEVDFAAGGVDIYSTYLNNGYATLSGTSFSTPALAGVGALILSDCMSRGEYLTPDELYARLERIAADAGASGFDAQTGNGIPVFRTE